ncbi:unnamed protein product, partial [Larinioides sclopetarius]
MPHTRSKSHRYPKRRNLNRRNPRPQVGSASSIRYSVLQPFPLHTLSHTNDYEYYRNDRRQAIPKYTPRPYSQNYASTPISRNEEQPPLIYINLQTVQNQKLPDTKLKSGNDPVYDQHTQVLQRFVTMRDAPGSENRPNYNMNTLPTGTPQNPQRGTVDHKAIPSQYLTVSRPSSGILSNMNYKET